MNKRLYVFFLVLFIGVFLIPFFPQVRASPDSITYNPDTYIITVLGFSEANPCNLSTIYDADLSGSLVLVANNTYNTDTTLNLTRQPRPADSGAITIITEVTGIGSGSGYTISFNGTDFFDNQQNEIVAISGIGNFSTSKSYKTIYVNGVFIDLPTGGGRFLTLEITQPRWGAISKSGDNQFMMHASIELGADLFSEGGHFAEEDKNILNFYITLKNLLFDSSSLRLGKLIDADLKTTEKGVNIISLGYNMIINQDSDSKFYLYSCSVTALERNGVVQIQGYSRIYNCIFDGIQLDIFPTSNSDFYRVTQYNQTYGLFITSDSDTYNDFFMYNNTNAIYLFLNYNASMVNFKLRSNNYTVYSNNIARDSEFINPDIDNYNFFWFGVQGTGEIWERYTFKINVTDIDGVPIENANVTLVDLDGNTEFSVLTWANGSFAEQIVSSGFWNRTGGNTQYRVTPHNLTITHANYTTLSYAVTIDEWKTITQVVLIQNGNGYDDLTIGLLVSFGLIISMLVITGIKIKRK